MVHPVSKWCKAILLLYPQASLSTSLTKPIGFKPLHDKAWGNISWWTCWWRGRQEQGKKYWPENQMVGLVYGCLLTGLLLEFPPSTWEKQKKSRTALSWTIYQVNPGQVGTGNRLVNISNHRQTAHTKCHRKGQFAERTRSHTSIELNNCSDLHKSI